MQCLATKKIREYLMINMSAYHTATRGYIRLCAYGMWVEWRGCGIACKEIGGMVDLLVPRYHTRVQ